MKLRELLDARRVVVPLKARSVRDATRQLAKSLVSSGAVRDEPKLTLLLKKEWPEDIVSVAGLIPADKPQYAVIVTLAKPDTIKTSAAAAPGYATIMKQVIKTFRIQPSTTPAADPPVAW